MEYIVAITKLIIDGVSNKYLIKLILFLYLIYAIVNNEFVVQCNKEIFTRDVMNFRYYSALLPNFQLAEYFWIFNRKNSG